MNPSSPFIRTALISLLFSTVDAQICVKEQIAIPPVDFSSKDTVWADFDKDGDLDFFHLKNRMAYRRDPSGFFGFEIEDATLTQFASAIWADIFPDGYPDLIVSGKVGNIDEVDLRLNVIKNIDGRNFVFDRSLDRIYGTISIGRMAGKDVLIAIGKYNPNAFSSEEILGIPMTAVYDVTYHGPPSPFFTKIDYGLPPGQGGGAVGQDLIQVDRKVYRIVPALADGINVSNRSGLDWVGRYIFGDFLNTSSYSSFIFSGQKVIRDNGPHDREYLPSTEFITMSDDSVRVLDSISKPLIPINWDKDGLVDVAAGRIVYRNSKGFDHSTSRELPCVPVSEVDVDLDGQGELICETDSMAFMLSKASNFEIMLPIDGISGARDGKWEDMNNDGWIDVVTSEGVFMGNATGKFSRIFNPVNGSPLAICDFNNDGLFDFITTGSIYLSTFGGYAENPVSFSVNDLQTVAVGDYDNDGDNDIFFSPKVKMGPPASETVFNAVRNNGSGQFSFFPDLGTEGYMGSRPDTIATLELLDHDQDGDLDFFVEGFLFHSSVGAGVQLPEIVPKATELRKAGAVIRWNRVLGPVVFRYNVKIGFSDGADDVVYSYSDSASGFRKFGLRPNAGLRDFFAVNGLKPGRYSWSVQAISPTHHGGPWSAIRRFRIGCDAPKGLSGETKNGAVRLTWDAVTPENFHAYYIYGGTNPDSIRLLDSTLIPVDTTKTIGHLENGVDWYFHVVAADQGTNESEPTQTIILRPDGTPPSVPDGLYVRAGPSFADLSWSPNTEPDFSRYVVYQRVTSSSSSQWVAIDSLIRSTDTLFTIHNLSPGTTHRLCLKSVDTVGNASAFSEEVAVTLTQVLSSPDSLDFGKTSWGASSTALVTLRNPTEAPIQVSTLACDNPQFTSDETGGFILSPKSQTSRILRFAPQGTGPFSAVLTVRSDAAVNPEQRIPLKGIGVSPSIAFDRAILDFGQVRAGQAKTLSVALINKGDGPLILDSLKCSHPYFSVPNAPLSIAPGASASLPVQFSPSDTTGSLEAAMLLFGNAGGSPGTIPLLGQGINTMVHPNVFSLDMGYLSLVEVRDTVIQWNNTGNAQVAVDSVNLNAPGFTILSSPSILPAKGASSMALRFASPALRGGDFQGTLTLHFEGRSVSLALGAHAKAPPKVQISQVEPRNILWSENAVSLFSSASDLDDAGAGAPIVAWIWKSDRDGILSFREGSFTRKASEFSIGTHILEARVVDNEGDTSAPAFDTLRIGNPKPFAAIDSIHPKGLLLRGGEDFRLWARGFDRDNGATPQQDGLREFSVHSNIQGLLSRSKEWQTASSDLRPGVHGLYARAIDEEGDTAYSDTVWLPVQQGIGRAMIVAGSALGDRVYFYMNIAPACNWAFGKLLQRGFTREQIEYLNPIGWQSLFNPDVNDHLVEEHRVSLATLKARLMSTRADVEKGVPLVLAFIGHGLKTEQVGKFILESGEALVPDTLSRWLDEIQLGLDATTPIIVLLDFCHAGSFFNRLLSARQNRVLIASSSEDRQAYFVGGRSFSQVFFTAVQDGKSVASSFELAKAWSDGVAPSLAKSALPLLSANADVLYNDEAGDLKPARQLYIGGRQQFQAVGAEWDSVTLEHVSGRRVRLRAVSEGVVAPDTAWFAILVPPEGAGDSVVSPWRGGLLARSPDGSYQTEVELPSEAGAEVLVSLFGKVGQEPMMPISASIPVPDGVAIAGRNALTYSMRSAQPNPFRGSTRIAFELPKEGFLDLRILDARGRTIRTLARGLHRSGRHELQWDGRKESGVEAGRGLYWIRLSGSQGILTRMVLKQ